MSVTSFEFLPWDSKLFKLKVARINGDSHDLETLNNIKAQMAQQKVQLAYYFCCANNDSANKAAQSIGGQLLDKKVTFATSLNPMPTCAEFNIDSITVESFKAHQPSEALIDLALQSAIYSRFKLDSHISHNKFVELYRLWAVNSVNRQFADEVLVIRHAGEEVAMVTLALKVQTAHIGLIAVSDKMRSRKLGQLLMAQSMKWAVKHNAQRLSVVTQLDNEGACRFYQKCGCHEVDRQHIYHIWIK
ncbi:MAG: hypothetical protein CMK65_01085 [Pseudoalteromonas sp.]|uniref:GNAT family N-acetyltransferase n=1 Tax=Pseudoalteromonas sp. TaxID=53249 RepID=UPI000C8CE496|nr:GNAT family N-acetyltransferase [Pseudoalteromonas sp.]MAD02208.1 hypothetical protein [Pseudoalteromonas sp.]|tara:strand:+ start:63179 stop:63916 length:738 start_codon:yes stop_codon:yes gene_type:complete